MSVEKTKLDFFSKRKIDEEQVLVESILNVPDAQKILWVEATAQVETVDAMTKEASFSGQVFLNAVYLDENKKIRATALIFFMLIFFSDDLNPCMSFAALINGAKS